MLCSATVTLVVFALAAPSLGDITNLDYAAFPARGADEDLWSYVTRPDLRPPKLDVHLYSRDRVASGYVFLAPYDCLQCSHRPTTTYVSQQIGPHIYDQNGDLVWSGVDLFPDRKVFNFQSVAINGAYYLALVAPQEEEWHTFSDGAAIILNDSYEITDMVNSTELGDKIDLHEFNMLDDQRTILLQSNAIQNILPEQSPVKGKFYENGFHEYDLVTRETKFRWNASEHIPLMESTNAYPKPDGPKIWDWLHMNSVDKDTRGNYLISGRFTDTLYYIAPTGDILWRLGGANSSFTQDFNFSRQHNARIRSSTRTSMTISFFDNAADDTGDWEPTSASSSLKVVTLDLNNMVATIDIQRYRPDNGHSEAKGNVQYLSNGNILAGWGENAYLTEFTTRPGGKQLIWEARFASPRFGNYRGYKMDWVGQPKTKPITKAFASTNYLGDISTSIYVSWNGATEVVLWRFYSQSPNEGRVYLGSAQRTGYETTYVADGYHPKVFAEAYDRYQNSLANSTLVSAELPLGFNTKPTTSKRPQARSDGYSLWIHWLVAFLIGVGITMSYNRFQNTQRNDDWRPKWLR